jgi:hypothetical protein
MMIKVNNKGVTLVEILTAMVVAAFAIAVIMAGYTLVNRIWNNYNHRMQASNSAWVTYISLEQLMKEAFAVKNLKPHEWLFLKGNNDSVVLSYTDSGLYVQKQDVRKFANIDSFTLDITDTRGLYPIWTCSFVYHDGMKKTGLNWRTICRGDFTGTAIPVKEVADTLQKTMYWDKNNVK